jgi:hypothetical protein
VAVHEVNEETNMTAEMGARHIDHTPTVDARQNGPWNVGISGIPTVRLDQTGNTVQFAARSTSVVFDSGLLVYSQDGAAITFGPIDVSPYSKIRLGVNNIGFHDIDIFVKTSLADSTPTLGNAFTVENFSVEDSEGDIDRGGPSVSKVYDVPGTKLFITVGFRNQTEGQYRIAVFGN